MLAVAAALGPPTLAGAAPAQRLAAADSADLSAARSVSGVAGGSVVRVQQRAGGLPVFGAEAVVARLEGKAPLLLADDTRPGVTAAATATVPRGSAVRRASRDVGAESLRGTARARLGVLPAGGGATAWQVMIPKARPDEDWLVYVDARTGSVLKRERLLREATGSAQLYDPNPVQMSNGWSGLTDRGDADSPDLTLIRTPVLLQDLTSPEGCLTGPWVEARVGYRQRGRAVCRASLVWNDVTRSGPAFEALMAYFHVDQAQRYIQSLQLTVAVNERPQLVQVNSLREDNSYYSPATRRIQMGRGGVDDAEDGDVIVHEYGHAVQDAQRPLFGRSFAGGAMGEGFGDYLAGAVAAEHAELPLDPVRNWNACMFEWDAIAYAGRRCARRINKDIGLRRTKRRCSGSIHCVGEAWSGALWKLRGTLRDDPEGRSVTDRTVLLSHFFLTQTPTFREGAVAVVIADGLLYEGAHCLAIDRVFVNRGFLDRGDIRC